MAANNQGLCEDDLKLQHKFTINHYVWLGEKLSEIIEEFYYVYIANNLYLEPVFFGSVR